MGACVPHCGGWQTMPEAGDIFFKAGLLVFTGVFIAFTLRVF